MTLPLNDPYPAISPSHAFISVENAPLPNYEDASAHFRLSEYKFGGLVNFGGLSQLANWPFPRDPRRRAPRRPAIVSAAAAPIFFYVLTLFQN
jgi:hypothetical protein